MMFSRIQYCVDIDQDGVSVWKQYCMYIDEEQNDAKS